MYVCSCIEIHGRSIFILGLSDLPDIYIYPGLLAYAKYTRAHHATHTYVPCRLIACYGQPITLANTSQATGILIYLYSRIKFNRVEVMFVSKQINFMPRHFVICDFQVLKADMWFKHCLNNIQ